MSALHQKAGCTKSSPRLHPSFRLVKSLIFLFLVSPGSPLLSQQSHPTEVQVKAAYLFNFGKFVRWPSPTAAGSGPFQICVLGKDPFGLVLNSTLDGGSIDDRKVAAKKIVTLQDSDNCQVVFVSASEEPRLKTILASARSARTLTVSDMPNFVARGGMIQFVPKDSKIRFEVNLPATEEAGITLSSELLKVATRVIGKTEN